MAFSLSNVLSGLVKDVNWLSEAEKGVTIAESLGPLLLKTATDGYNAAKGSGSLLSVLTDIERDIPAFEQAFRANNTEVALSAPAPAPAPNADESSATEENPV